MTAEPIERHWPKQWADEELTLQWGALQKQFLTFLRITAVNKIAELDPALAAAAPIKTSPFMTLIGVIKHLTAVERNGSPGSVVDPSCRRCGWTIPSSIGG